MKRERSCVSLGHFSFILGWYWRYLASLSWFQWVRREAAVKSQTIFSVVWPFFPVSVAWLNVHPYTSCYVGNLYKQLRHSPSESRGTIKDIWKNKLSPACLQWQPFSTPIITTTKKVMEEKNNSFTWNRTLKLTRRRNPNANFPTKL